MVGDSLLLAALQFSQRFGCANGWTGTTGTAAKIIHDMLAYLEENGDEAVKQARLQWASGELTEHGRTDGPTGGRYGGESGG